MSWILNLFNPHALFDAAIKALARITVEKTSNKYDDIALEDFLAKSGHLVIDAVMTDQLKTKKGREKMFLQEAWVLGYTLGKVAGVSGSKLDDMAITRMIEGYNSAK